IRSPSPPSSAANTALDSLNANGRNGNALVGATSPSVAPAIKNSRAPARRSANIFGSGPSRLSGNTSRRNSPPASRLIASAFRHPHHRRAPQGARLLRFVRKDNNGTGSLRGAQRRSNLAPCPEQSAL